MYEELQCDKGPYRTVHVYTCFTSKHVFLACTDKKHTNYTLLHMSGLAVGIINFAEYRETSLVIFPCTQCMERPTIANGTESDT